MRRAAELAAQVFTARESLLRDTAEDQRVAFLLLDSATETLMVRHIKSAMVLGKWNWGRYTSVPLPGWELVAVDLNDMEQKIRVEEESAKQFVRWQLSDTQMARVDREFESKLKLLAWEGDIPIPYISVLARLHEYRNEMYHREESRPDALRIVVHLYAWLVADLLGRLDGGGMIFSSSDDDDLADRTYARMGRQAPEKGRFLFGGQSVQADMAEALREGLDLATASELLADYSAERVSAVHEAIEFSADFLGSAQGVEHVTEMDVVRLLYSTDWRKSIQDLRGSKTPVTRAMIRRWDDWPSQIRVINDPVEAFRSLAEFEVEFEPFEHKVTDLAVAIDREIQYQIDVARGK